MAVPGPFDGFWTFPRSKTGYSGVCTFVDSRYCVPLKAEEGITGLLLDDKLSTMKPPWTMEEKIGHYPNTAELDFTNELDGAVFEPRRLDMEGRSVVCDFGLVVDTCDRTWLKSLGFSSFLICTAPTKPTRLADRTR